MVLPFPFEDCTTKKNGYDYFDFVTRQELYTSEDIFEKSSLQDLQRIHISCVRFTPAYAVQTKA
jgi:hypothetical protein